MGARGNRDRRRTALVCRSIRRRRRPRRPTDRLSRWPNSLDVAARLAEGRPAVDNIGDYVWACHLLGYQNPDLTLHAAQVRDWYGSEDGLDLRALEADRAALDAAATATRQCATAAGAADSARWPVRGRAAAATLHTSSFSGTAKHPRPRPRRCAMPSTRSPHFATICGTRSTKRSPPRWRSRTAASRACRMAGRDADGHHGSR